MTRTTSGKALFILIQLFENNWMEIKYKGYVKNEFDNNSNVKSRSVTYTKMSCNLIGGFLVLPFKKVLYFRYISSVLALSFTRGDVKCADVHPQSNSSATTFLFSREK